MPEENKFALGFRFTPPLRELYSDSYAEISIDFIATSAASPRYLRRVCSGVYKTIAHSRIYACLFAGKIPQLVSRDGETAVFQYEVSSVASFAAAGCASGVVCAPG